LRTLLRPFRGFIPGGLTKVTKNLCAGLDNLGQAYQLHHCADSVDANNVIGILRGPIDDVRNLAGAHISVTGVGVLNFGDEWPNLFEETRTAFHLQACEWAAALYRPFFGDRIRIWPVGIDTNTWSPLGSIRKEYDFLVYNKLRWPHEHPEPDVREYCLAELNRRGLKFAEICYGRYQEKSYHALLAQSSAMLFLCENETQGIAYNEALSMGVPILAWNPGLWLDPGRHAHNLSHCFASSVPYWDERCGEQFTSVATFAESLESFLARSVSGKYKPRDYILENLTLERGAQTYVNLIAEAADHG
jgi:hypothetical protein